MHPSRFKTTAPALSRDEIVDAALARLEADGSSSLTLRSLADDLDVTPMALYRHVRNKDDILLAVCVRLLEAEGLPSSRLGWERYLRQLSLRLRELLLRHPELVGVFNHRPVTAPFAQDRLAAAVDVLARAGFGEDDAIRAYATVHTYTIGFCSVEAGRRAAGPVETDDDGPLAETIRGFVADEQFEFGLETILRGLRPLAVSD